MQAMEGVCRSAAYNYNLRLLLPCAMYPKYGAYYVEIAFNACELVKLQVSFLELQRLGCGKAKCAWTVRVCLANRKGRKVRRQHARMAILRSTSRGTREWKRISPTPPKRRGGKRRVQQQPATTRPACPTRLPACPPARSPARPRLASRTVADGAASCAGSLAAGREPEGS